MNRKILPLIICLLCTGLLSTCSHEEQIDGKKKEPKISDAISIVEAAPTKAAITGLTAMQGDANGFRVYATLGTSPITWYADDNGTAVDGTSAHNHKYNSSGSTWGFVPAIYWPLAGFPMTFYALYPSNPIGLSISGISPSALNFTYTVPATNQVDLVAVKSTATARPSGGVHPIRFRHILAMVDFSIVPGIGTTPKVLKVDVSNIRSTRTFDFADTLWTGTASVPANYTYYPVSGYPATGSRIWPPAPITAVNETDAYRIYPTAPVDVSLDKHLMAMPQTSPAWSPSVLTGGLIELYYRMGTAFGLPPGPTGTPHEVGYTTANQHPNYAGGYNGALFVKAGFPLQGVIAGANFTWDRGNAYHYKIGLGTANSCNGYILDEYYYDSLGVRTGLKLIEVLREGKHLYDKLQDGIIHVVLDVHKWDEYSQEPNPPAMVQVMPRTLNLPYRAQQPAVEWLTVVCQDGLGNPDPAKAWTLSVPPLLSWLRLSLNADGSMAGTSISSTGSRNVYLVVDANIGTPGTPAAVRSANLTLNGGITTAAVVNQAAFPNPFTGWLYVKDGATGEGFSWSNALGSMTDAINLAVRLQNAPHNYTVKGILVAGGGNGYAETVSVPSNVSMFGGWTGVPGTELTASDGATTPYTIMFESAPRVAYRNLQDNKAVVSKNVTVSGANSLLDGFIIRYVTGSVTPLVVDQGGKVNAVQVNYNTLTGSTPAFACTNAGTAANILISNNNTGMMMSGGSVLLNATVVNNPGASSFNNATVYNSVFWNNGATTFAGSSTVQYCGFVDGDPAIALNANNLPLNASNVAWFSSTNLVPGPHFNMVANASRPYYAALDDHAPMLGRGNQALFDTYAPFIPTTAQSDINGKERNHLGIDMGCYEDGVFRGFRLEWASDRVYISSKSGAVNDIPMLVTGNEVLLVGMDWTVSAVGSPVDWTLQGAPVSGSGAGVMVGIVKILTNTNYTSAGERQVGNLLYHTNLGVYLPDKTIQVWQIPGRSDLWENGYVGTFHKNNEVSERYITGENSYATNGSGGKGYYDYWSARVVSGLDWIKIDRNPKGYNGGIVVETPGGVVTGTTPVGGDRAIRFRVGMKSVNPNPAQPRYGLIVISRGNNPAALSGSTWLFVRQGEEADYVYRPSDPRPVTGTRANAAKWSPYNIIAPSGYAMVNQNPGVALPTNGAAFVDYPTKIGDFFLRNKMIPYRRGIQTTNLPTAAYPTTPNYGWVAAQEVCPPGYRHPSHAELYESLYPNIPNLVPVTSVTSVQGNDAETMRGFMWGYYADGYFDQIAPDPVTAVNAGEIFYYTGAGGPAVLSSGNNFPSNAVYAASVAAKGTLMVNHANFASLFFPMAGTMMADATARAIPADNDNQGHVFWQTYEIDHIIDNTNPSSPVTIWSLYKGKFGMTGMYPTNYWNTSNGERGNTHWVGGHVGLGCSSIGQRDAPGVSSRTDVRTATNIRCVQN